MYNNERNLNVEQRKFMKTQTEQKCDLKIKRNEYSYIMVKCKYKSKHVSNRVAQNISMCKNYN